MGVTNVNWVRSYLHVVQVFGGVEYNLVGQGHSKVHYKVKVFLAHIGLGYFGVVFIVYRSISPWGLG